MKRGWLVLILALIRAAASPAMFNKLLKTHFSPARL